MPKHADGVSLAESRKRLHAGKAGEGIPVMTTLLPDGVHSHAPGELLPPFGVAAHVGPTPHALSASMPGRFRAGK